ncbi:ABC transporter substrate-binding protein [Sporosarcina sp. Te-1]|uniref:ABC transporter substrate-binding protein n=1 Tax=Sporosarcina sp. Te-1 TaxID=2818390 RepID=UPI001A9CDE9F|nr:ABC transporter substrate-binding protein [Sporosarcina sp. Te-1]QTD41028.1 ABC transporter substrate-binding protein [Sporosarcina sp. Te-1]
MKKISVLLSLMLILLLGACNTTSDGESSQSATPAETAKEKEAVAMDEPKEPVEIEFWHAMNGDHEKTLEKITDDFNAQNEHITVKLVNQGGYGDLSQKLMASAKAKTLPTLSQAYEDWVTEYIQNDLVADLTPYVEDAEAGMTDEDLNDIVDVFREANMWDGKFYSMPFNKSTRVLFYNKELLEEAGVAAPTNWDELKSAADKLTTTKDGKNIVGMGFENGVGMELIMWVKQAGGDFIDEKNRKVLFNSPEGIEALSFINSMIQDGTARLAGEDGYMSGPFTRGDVAMYIGSNAGIAFVANDAEGNIEWTTAPVPDGKKKASAFMGTNVAMFNSATDEEKAAAWEYMKFLISKENTTYWARNTGYLPVRYSALQSEEWKKFIEENPEYGVAQEQFDGGFYDPRVIGAYGVKNAINKEVEFVLLGQKSVEQGLEDAEKAAQAELDKANR